MSWLNDWYEEEHLDDYNKVSSISIFPNKKSSRIRRREFIKNKSIKIYNMEEFDLEKAKNGASLITRNGKKAKIISFYGGTNCFPIMVELENYNSNPVLYDEDGCANICCSAFGGGSDPKYDLLINEK